MTRFLHSLRTPAAVLLVATATLAALPAARADGRLDLAASRYTETADGALLLGDAPVRLAHQPGLVASHCIRVETPGGRQAGGRSSLVNGCDHAVDVSYCIDADEARTLRCDAVGRRGFASVAIAARGRLPVAAPTPAGAELQWVACRAGDDHYSTLTDDGRRGECLVAEGPTAIARSGR